MNGSERRRQLADELLEIASEQALVAGKLLLERFARERPNSGVRSKSTPTDLVSDADLLAERSLREGLASARPDDGFLGEEGDDRHGSSGLRWIVDPLDGTVNYLFGIPQWCVSVAVEDGEGTLAGLIWDPVREEMFTATRGGEPTLGTPAQGDARAARPGGGHARTLESSTRADLARAMVATGFAYDAELRARQARVLVRLLPRVRDIRRCGSAALDLAWTAAGRYDAFYERGVHVWDVAAGLLLCEQAGLEVRELVARDGLPWGVLAAPATLVDALLELVDDPS